MKTFYKNIAILFIVFSVIGIALSLQSCSKEVETKEVLGVLTPTKLDQTAGTWTPIILTDYSTQVPVAAPAATTSDAYLAEIAAIKDAQSKLTKSQRSIIEYWSAGGVLRWNQILRELVARYNLPPAPKADGSYPLPDAENPFADPAFPFSNPPYAARAYSYVSVAQYDALKAAWFYKFQYNRPSPYKVDSSVESLMPPSDLPAYPSEDAVLSGVTAEMLKVLFPAAVEEITLRAGDQRYAALWSGKATSSDISAGLALGKAVAAIITAPGTGRFRTDGMGAAVGNPAQWKALEDGAIARGEIPWISRDLPIRPPMLPNFGKVKAWNMTPTQITDERPLPPPPTLSSEMSDEVEEVKFYADNLSRERLAIVHKWADGAGTYTPPGHWNDIAEEYVAALNYSEVRAARAFALLNMAIHDAGVACWETKYFYFNPRPSQLDESIRTGTGIPNFPAYTSGHSTFSASAATVLTYLFPSDAQYFNEAATEASFSRLYGAIHYRSDCEKGITHGNKIGGYTVTFAINDGAGN
ncbi:MAG: phosphatase PAP2 family protein [Bacteroidota bacterium]